MEAKGLKMNTGKTKLMYVRWWNSKWPYGVCNKGVGKVDRPITDGLNTDLHLDIGNGVLLEKVDKFCYIGDVLDADGRCDSAVTAKVSSASKKSR